MHRGEVLDDELGRSQREIGGDVGPQREGAVKDERGVSAGSESDPLGGA